MRSDVRRQQFIDAAVVVVGRVGVDGATTRRIAEEAGAPLATLHYCFGTKEALLWAVFEQLADMVQVEVAAAAGPGGSVADQAAALLRETARWGVAHRDHNRAQIEIWLWAERNDPDFAVRIYDRYIDTCKEVLRRTSQPLGEAKLETVISVIVALVDGLAMQLATEAVAEGVLRDAETAAAMIRAYLESDQGRSAGAVGVEALRRPA